MDEVPPIVSSYRLSTYLLEVKYFDGYGFTAGQDLQQELVNVLVDNEKFVEYLEGLWPYVKRCAEARVWDIDLPEFRLND